MKIAVPVADGKLCMHFGHCQQFAILETDGPQGKIIKREDLDPPPHEPGVLPRWLVQLGVKCVIAGGMGQRAQQLFAEHGVEVKVGAPAQTPEQLVQDYLAGKLTLGANICDH
ncbi:MAG: ATPase [Deltaproteobacteria bacterium]|nr:ATPase [Deltaproteobacteria bacterium]